MSCSTRFRGQLLSPQVQVQINTASPSGQYSAERHMPQPTKTIALVNGTGRQAASVIRAVSAVGWSVRAQVWSLKGLVAEELAELPNVTLFEGPVLGNPSLLDQLFDRVQYAFINTISMAGDEVKQGKALADAAKRAGVQYYLYSSMPDHSVYESKWPALPQWAPKFTVENYIRQIGLPATFVYAGIYNNNFTSLPYPLFSLDFKDDDTIEWKAPFNPNTKLPWLDTEHDMGPAVLQILKDGPSKWKDKRIALAFETLTPLQVCKAFERALEMPCKYVWSENIDIRVPIPSGYQEQLEKVEILFGKYNAPYFPDPEFDFGKDLGRSHPDGNRRSSETIRKPKKLTTDARQLWEGYRGIEEYAREAFLIEEQDNGKTWMVNKSVST